MKRQKDRFSALILCCMLMLPATYAYADPVAELEIPPALVSMENLDISSATGAPVAIEQEKLDAMKSLTQGTFLVEFTPESFNVAHSLVGISNGQPGNANTYVNFFFSQNRLGLEVRDQNKGNYVVRFATVSLQVGTTYHAAVSADPAYGYKIFLDGEKVLDVPNSSLGVLGYGFIGSLTDIDSAYIGMTNRVDLPTKPMANKYRYNGTIEKVDIYGAALSETYLLAATTPIPPLDAPIFTAEAVTIPADAPGFEITGSELNQIKALTQGTVMARFTPETVSGVHSLFGISNGTPGNANSYFSLYFAGGKLGFEIRRQTGGDIQKSSVDVDIVKNQEQYVAFTADPTYGYKLFLNGELVLTVPNVETYGFIADIPNINAGYLGMTKRTNSNGTAANQYPFVGTIATASVYSQVLPDEYLITQTGVIDTTGRTPVRKMNLFVKEDWNSPAFRIPSIVTTDNGVIIAAADIRFGDSNDSPNNIDTGIRTSSDGGATWSAPKLILNFLDYPNVPTTQIKNSASFIDIAMVKGDSNRVFLFVDVQPGGYGYQNAIASSGYITVNGALKLALRNDAGEQYYLDDDGVVYQMNGTATEYAVGEQFALFKNGEEISNIFYKTSPIKVLPTCFVCMTYSDDDGETWSDPRLINPGIKTDDMKFLGTGPGVGIQLKNGANAGRLVVPLYYTSVNHTTEWNCLIYSDDNGVTWHRGESPNDGRIGGAQKMHEAQIVEMPDGQLYMYSRNVGKASVAISFDGGETWDDTVFSDNTIIMSSTTGCQLSIINYNQPVNGKPAVLLSNPAALTRSNGSVRVGLIETDGTYSGTNSKADGRTKYVINWVSQKVVRSGEFAYSCLAELPNGNIGLLYEENNLAYTLDHLVYAEYTLDYLMGVAQSE